jgi:hypothetical protein
MQKSERGALHFIKSLSKIRKPVYRAEEIICVKVKHLSEGITKIKACEARA